MQLPYTVTNVWRAIHVWELFTCETSHQSEILHSLIIYYSILPVIACIAERAVFKASEHEHVNNVWEPINVVIQKGNGLFVVCTYIKSNINFHVEMMFLILPL